MDSEIGSAKPLSSDKRVQADVALAMAAFFWGSTFVVQREAMEYMTPLAYTSVRFFLGALALLPFALFRARRQYAASARSPGLPKLWLAGSLISGSTIFVGMCFQQYGLVWTTAGKAGFITSLYVVVVPLFMLLLGRRILLGEILGALLAVLGLYLLSFTDKFALAPGDGLVLAGAFVWAAQILSLGWLSPKMDSLVLAAGQALVCALLAFVATLVLGQFPAPAVLSDAAVCILWGGLLSVAMGFTLQVYGQKYATPAAAAIIMQMEAVVAALSGWVLLGEKMTGRMVLGAAVMLAGILISQLWGVVGKNKTGQA